MSFDPPNNPKNQNFEKNKKILGDIIILHLCTTNDNQDAWCLIYYQAWQTEFFVILDYFCPFTLLTIQKIKILKKWKNLLEILSFTQVYHKWQSYDIWSLRYQLQQTIFFAIFGHFFFPFQPPNRLKNENIKKLEKSPGDIVILQKCTKNHDRRLYCSCDMVCPGCICYFSFWAIFYPFNSKVSKKLKNSSRYHHFNKCTKIHDHMLYCSWDMVHDRCNCYVSLWANFCPCPQFQKNEKNLEILSFYTSVQKIMIISYTVPEIWHVMDVIVFHFGQFLALLPC